MTAPLDVVLEHLDALVPLDVAIDAMPGLINRAPAPDTVRKWRQRGRLVPEGGLYRLGDILWLALDAHHRTGPLRQDFARDWPVGYNVVHWRIVRELGRAATFDCVECGGRAAHWSYNHTVDSEIRDELGQVYSLDLDSYSPRCARCHVRFDHEHAQLVATTQGERPKRAYSDGDRH